MERIEFEAVGLALEGGKDELVRGEAAEGFEAFGVVVGVEESGEVAAEMGVGEVVIVADGGVFDGAIHAFDLAVGPGMVGLGQAVIDAAQ